MPTITKNTVTFKVVELASDSIHNFESIKRYDSVAKKLVVDQTPSTWYQTGDSDASEAVATNKTHALIAVFGTKNVEVPEIPTT